MSQFVVALRLSPREVECCILLASGESYKGVGRELSISERTARFHAGNAARRILKSCPWISRSDNAPQKVILRYFVQYAGTEAFRPASAAA